MIIMLTLIVEILQFITYRGSTDIDDIILNTIGAVIVYVLIGNGMMKYEKINIKFYLLH